MFTVVAYYTVGTPYEEEILNLKESCQKFKLKTDIEGVKNLGSWQRNTQYKAKFLLRKVKVHFGTRIVYLDCDAKVQKYPDLFDTMTEDVGVHYRDGSQLLSGTIFLNCNERVEALIKSWVQMNKQNPLVWDQHNLKATIIRMNRHENKVSVRDLPPQYCQIFDSMRKFGNPVIEHFQASRRFKKIVGP